MWRDFVCIPCCVVLEIKTDSSGPAEHRITCPKCDDVLGYVNCEVGEQPTCITTYYPDLTKTDMSMSGDTSEMMSTSLPIITAPVGHVAGRKIESLDED